MKPRLFVRPSIVPPGSSGSARRTCKRSTLRQLGWPSSRKVLVLRLVARYMPREARSAFKYERNRGLTYCCGHPLASSNQGSLGCLACKGFHSVCNKVQWCVVLLNERRVGEKKCTGLPSKHGDDELANQPQERDLVLWLQPGPELLRLWHRERVAGAPANHGGGGMDLFSTERPGTYLRFICLPVVYLSSLDSASFLEVFDDDIVSDGERRLFVQFFHLLSGRVRKEFR